jgi:hypothetical protein
MVLTIPIALWFPTASYRAWLLIPSQAINWTVSTKNYSHAQVWTSMRHRIQWTFVRLSVMYLSTIQQRPVWLGLLLAHSVKLACAMMMVAASFHASHTPSKL